MKQIEQILIQDQLIKNNVFLTFRTTKNPALRLYHFVKQDAFV